MYNITANDDDDWKPPEIHNPKKFRLEASFMTKIHPALVTERICLVPIKENMMMMMMDDDLQLWW